MSIFQLIQRIWTVFECVLPGYIVATFWKTEKQINPICELLSTWFHRFLKPLQNKKGQKNLCCPTKKQASSKEKDCFFVGYLKLLGSSYFEAALVQNSSFPRNLQPGYQLIGGSWGELNPGQPSEMQEFWPLHHRKIVIKQLIIGETMWIWMFWLFFSFTKCCNNISRQNTHSKSRSNAINANMLMLQNLV